jgi:competence protein ComEC
MVPLAGVLMIGCAVGVWHPGHWITALLGAAAALVAVAVGVKKNRWQLAAPMALIAALGYLSAQPWMAPPFRSGHAVHYVDQGTVPIAGRVVDSPRVATGRQKLHLDLIPPGGPDAPGPRRGRIRVTVQGLAPAFARGDILRFSARLRSPRNFHNPGGFDYRRYLSFQGVRATAYTTADEVERSAAGTDSGVAGMAERFRRRVGALLEANFPRDSAAVLAALTVGDQSRIDDDLRTAFNRVGVGHLLAISGLHVAIVAALMYGLLRRLFGWMPLLLERGWTKKAAALASAIAVWGYAVLAGMSPSTERAALMVSVYLGAMLIDRERDLPNTLALAALVVIGLHPPSLFSISFQLSFLAVAWILVGCQPKAPKADPDEEAAPSWLRRWVRWLWNWMRQCFLVSLWATLGTMPVVMQTFQQVSLVGIAANFIFVPVMGILVVYPALAGTALVPISTSLALCGFHLADLLLAPCLDLLDIMAAWPWSAVATFTPRAEEIVLFYAALGIGAAWRRWPAAGGVPPWRAALAALVLAGWTVDGLYWGHRRFWHSDLRATVLDVGQGSAAVLELPGGAVAIVDGGGFSDNRIFDVGRAILAPFLRYQKICAVDLVVLTHANADHLNGLLFVLEHFPVGQVWSNHQGAETFGYRQFVDTIERRRIPWPAFERLPRRSRLGDAGIEMLHPAPGPGPPTGDANNDSIVLRVSTPYGAILLTGDIEAPAEQAFLSRIGGKAAADVLLVPHHGSRTSSSASLLEVVHPKEAIISCGWRNRYRMPHREVIGRLEACGARIWRTDRQGALTVVIDNGGVTVTPFLTREDPVAPDGVAPRLDTSATSL